MRIGTSIVPALALLTVAASDQVRAQPQPQRPRATPQAQAQPPPADTQEPRRLGRSYPLPPPPIPQREPPQFYVAAPPASSIHRKVGEGRNNGSRMRNATPSDTP